MSRASESVRGWVGPAVRAAIGDPRPARLLVLGAALALVGSFLAVLYRIADVVGGTRWLLLAAAGGFALATPLSRRLSTRAGIGVGAALAAAGYAVYLATLPTAYYALFSLSRAYGDLASLLTGGSILLLVNADRWVVALAPAPVFLVWYLALRRRYAAAALAGGAALGFLVLTGDAARGTALLGVTAALSVVGLGAIERREGVAAQVQEVGLVAALAILAARSIDLVPGGRARAGVPTDGRTATLEGSLIGGDGVPAAGSISLSPALRFTVRADARARWRVGAHDRYTGEGWVRAGGSEPYGDSLDPPPGETERLRQRVNVESPLRALPAAWKPVTVEDAAGVRVTETGDLHPAATLSSGDRYAVTSQRPVPTERTLRRAGRDYPEAVRERYLQLPGSLPDRLAERAREITADADGPYAAVRAIEDWLGANKGYTLGPGTAAGDLADAFVFEMEAGYCVHFATALAVLLRTLSIPARLVVGYTPGERVGGDRWIVRGFDSHAWVEVYFPDVGWIAFDPTPADARREATREWFERRGGAVGSGRAGDGEAERSAPEESAEGTPTPSVATATATPTPTAAAGGDRAFETGTPPPWEGAPAATPTARANASEGPAVPTRSQGDRDRGGDRLSLIAGVAGLLLGAHRLGAFDRLWRAVRLRRQRPTGRPAADIRRSFERLELLLARRYRERRDGETPREYVAAIPGLDERARRVVALYERVRYAGTVDGEHAEEAIRLVDSLVRDGETE